MEQKEFEAAIAKYATRKKDSVIPEFEIKLNNRHHQIDISTQEVKRKTRENRRKVTTPDGTFNGIRAVASHYKKTTMWVYNQIHKGKGFTYDT